MNGLLLISLAFIAAGIWWLMPGPTARPRLVGLAMVIAGGVGQASALRFPGGELTENILFWTFGGGALLFAVLMITSRNPVYGALWFALVTLCTCGLFLLQSAPFLAAATVIVYAGAIVVTFVFVIMLAQQSGETAYDQRSRHPALVTIAAVILLGALLATLQKSGKELIQKVASAANSNPLSQVAADQPLGTMHGLGRSLFGDYLFAVELAGTLLLIASIGAIVIAPRREGGTL